MNAQIIDDFVTTWQTKDVDKLMAFFTDDAVYTNIPMGPPNEGKAAIRLFIEAFLKTTSSIKFEVHNQVEGSNGIVMNERTDYLNFNGSDIALPVMGVFEFKDGKIAAWRDYFDMALFNQEPTN
jgi:limonene-1,2-epoxide hydrolase